MTLFSKSGFDDQTRREFVYRFTSGRTNSTRDLTLQEIKVICGRMQSSSFASNVNANNQLASKKKRSIVLAIATKVGIHDTSNWSKFNSFMKDRSILKKQLNHYTLSELDKLIKQFRGIESNFEKSAKKAGTIAHSTKYKLPLIVFN